MKIFVTGATGFIGQALIKKLVAENYKVSALARSQKQKKLLKEKGVKKVVLGDIANPRSFQKELASCDAVVHLAAMRGNLDAEGKMKVINAKVIKNLFPENSKLKHFILTSSVYAHGKSENLPINEDSPIKPYDAYGESKALAEEITRKLCKKYNIPFTILRPAIVYGPGDTELGFVTKLVNLIKNKKLPLFGNGENLMHLVYIDDLINAYLSAIKGGGKNKAYIIAGPKPIKLNKLISIIKSKMKVQFEPRKLPPAPFYFLAKFLETIFVLGSKTPLKIFKKDPPLTFSSLTTLTSSWHYDTTLAQKELGFKPKISYEKGLSYFLKNLHKRKQS